MTLSAKKKLTDILKHLSRKEMVSICIYIRWMDNAYALAIAQYKIILRPFTIAKCNIFMEGNKSNGSESCMLPNSNRGARNLYSLNS